MSEDLEAVASQADKALPGVEVEIGGKKRTLKYTLYSLCKLEEKTGKNPFDGSLFKGTGPRDMAALIWAGLVHEEENLEIDSVTRHVSLNQMRVISEAVGKAFAQTMPSEDAKKNSGDQPKKEAKTEIAETPSA